MPVFNIPSGLIRILDRDLQAAGIPKRDDRNRVVDIHAMRTTFGTHLSKGGVPLRTAQAAMRHSQPELTANVYTDPRLLDVAGALDALPTLSLKDLGGPQQTVKATGTDGRSVENTPAALAPLLAPPRGNLGLNGGTGDHHNESAIGQDSQTPSHVNAYPGNKKGSQSTCDHEPFDQRAKGFEPSTFTLGT